MIKVFLDEQYRTPGIDHLDQYRDSCFYNLFNKSTKERGSAYEEICAKILRAEGKDVKVAPASHGNYDLIVDDVRYELKASRKASQYDTRKRSYQFNHIKDNDVPILLMIMRPDDVVAIYETTFDAIKNDLGIMHKDKKGNGVDWNLAKHPDDISADLITEVKVA